MPIQDATGALRRVYVRPPAPGDETHWREFGWHAAPDIRLAQEEHAALRSVLTDAGADVVVARALVLGDPDAIYTYDPVLLTDLGTIALRSGKEGRRGEADAVAEDLEDAGVEIVARIEGPGTADGGDMFWLDPATLVVGRGYRTNDEGIAQLRGILEPSGVAVVQVDLPHHLGPASCLHLLSFISPLDRDLAVAFVPMVPVRLMELLRHRGVELVAVPEDEFASQGSNVLALAPRVALALDGNPETRRRMDACGVDVRTYQGIEISRKGDGGPTCLTRPIERG
jgi:dimethylargininase